MTVNELYSLLNGRQTWSHSVSYVDTKDVLLSQFPGTKHREYSNI